MTVYVGVDWAQEHHDVCVLDDAGSVLAARRVADGIAGLTQIQQLLGEHADDPVDVVVGIELDRGLLVTALVACGYRVIKIEPIATARYRERFTSSGGKSDTSDARVLADAVRTDGHLHRQVTGETDLAAAVRVLARQHQTAIWDRTRNLQRLRQALREYFPAALDAFADLGHPDALAVLAIAPTPTRARQLSRSKIASALRRGGRQVNVDRRAAEIQDRLRADHLEAPAVVTDAYATVTSSLTRLLTTQQEQIKILADELATTFGEHPDAAILLSFPGLGDVLGARVLGEFGDDPNRFTDLRARRNYAGTSPITRASGKQRGIRARTVRNRRLADAIDRWAFCTLTVSPGCKAFYNRQRATGHSHGQALTALGNKLVGMLHGCLRHRTTYDEAYAWRDQPALAA